MAAERRREEIVLKVAITGGGTGGHVFPGVAVAEALRALPGETEILFIGGSRGLEATAIPDAGFEFRAVPVRSLLGRRLLAVPMVLWTLLRGVVSAYRILRRFDPDVIFATGGYVSGAVAIAGRLLRRPLVLHEQNSVPGLTNRLLARIADEVHLSIPSARRYFTRRHHLRLSGNPVRREILAGNARRALRDYGFSPERRTILILGGSQGARSINRAAVETIRALRRRDDLQFILQTGRRDQSRLQRQLRRLRDRVRVRAFIRNMGDAYALADLVVARAGATSLAEIAAAGRAAILIPYPHASHNHQEANARVLREAGAARVVPDRRLTGRRLTSEIANIIDTPRKLREMSNSALLMARPDAAQKIARALRALVSGGVEENGNGEESMRG
ncbi:MAG: undecaprenyldiphospho-muramoylpentapeptide beta-N-acetylglucosaminyltransferase [Candidatus Eisenbacteria bacterium]|nr:undecaprenyldiphospho-muramoylpentapeptide beta-N-acetylglucosaminyltransferase [Candidatus Eisenbacteria bacterium]